MRDGFDLKRFICIYGKKILPALILGMAAGAVVFLLTDLGRMLIFHNDTTFRSDVMYHINFDTAEAEETKLYYNDYTWNDVLDSDVIAGVAAAKLSLSKEEVAKATHIPTMSDIRLIHVYADADTAEAADRIQSAIGEALATFGTDTDGFVSIEKWDEKETIHVKADPYYSRWCVCGALTGLIFGVLSLLWKYACDDGLYLDDDTERLAGISTAGVVFTDKSSSLGFKANLESIVKDKEVTLFFPGAGKDKDREAKAEETLKSMIGEITGIGRTIAKKEIKTSKGSASAKNVSTKAEDKAPDPERGCMIIAIPYGISAAVVRRGIRDMKMQGECPSAAILYDADRMIYKAYYLTI
ncbi:MAG: hypothetical protein K6C99_10080 [Lachnospiraceae bacterium]|nr:hypothetical protein [Lachnospiraceae bacterium]